LAASAYRKDGGNTPTDESPQLAVSNSTIAKRLQGPTMQKKKPKLRKTQCITAAAAAVKTEKAPAFRLETISPHHG
jgi:hypothetical protein